MGALKLPHAPIILSDHRSGGRLAPRVPLESWTTQALIRALAREDKNAVRAVERVESSLAALADRLTVSLKKGGRLFYVGAGTSGRLGMLDAVELPPTFGVSPRLAQAIVAGGNRALVRAVEGAEDDEAAARRQIVRAKISAHDFVVGISASGTTPFVLAALKEARRRRAHTVLLCCQKPRASPATQVVFLDTGPELIPGSTRLKAGTATKLALNALSTAAMVRFGRVHRGQMVDLLATNQKLRTRALRLVRTLAAVDESTARSLLARAKGAPRLALAIHYTGLDATRAKRALKAHGLPALEKASYSRRS